MKKTTNQLVDNSTIKEVAKVLYADKNEKINKAAVVDNLLVVTHAAIVGKKINYISDGRSDIFLKDKYIKNLNNNLDKKLLPLKYNKLEEDQKVLEEARNDIREYIDKHSKSFINIFKAEIDLTSLMEEEIEMYLGEGFKHYWDNITGKDNSKPIVKPTGLYNLFDSTFNNVNISDINKIDSFYEKHYKKVFSEIFNEEMFNKEMIKPDVKKFRWLPLLSHIVRSQYYITITTKEDVIYNPLNARKRFSRGLLNTALNSKTNKTSLITNDRNKLLYWSFNHLIKKSKKRTNFLTSLTDLTIGTDKKNPLKDVSEIFGDLTTINHMQKGFEKDSFSKELKKKIKSFDRANGTAKNQLDMYEYVTELSEEEKERLFVEDDMSNLGIGTILISDNSKLIKDLGYNFNKFIK